MGTRMLTEDDVYSFNCFARRIGTRMLQSFTQLTKSRRLIAGLAAALLLLGTAAASAELRISGSRDSVSIEAHNAPLKEILDALRKPFHVEYKPVAGLERPVTGTYSGSLHRVLTRLLVGRDYVIRTSGRGMEVVILGVASARAEPAPSQNATWRDGDGQLVAAPEPGRFAGADAPETWRDGDGNLVARPAQIAQFATADTPATWKDGDGNLIAPPPSH
jgi:hypothetical protein